MVEKCNRVLILENAKAVVVPNNLAERAAFVECAGLRAHGRLDGL